MKQLLRRTWWEKHASFKLLRLWVHRQSKLVKKKHHIKCITWLVISLLVDHHWPSPTSLSQSTLKLPFPFYCDTRNSWNAKGPNYGSTTSQRQKSAYGDPLLVQAAQDLLNSRTSKRGFLRPAVSFNKLRKRKRAKWLRLSKMLTCNQKEGAVEAKKSLWLILLILDKIWRNK